MLNWEMEFKKWCPAFKLLTYYGTAKERKAKRQGWSKPHAFHVCITSYTLALQDAKVMDCNYSNCSNNTCIYTYIFIYLYFMNVYVFVYMSM